MESAEIHRLTPVPAPLETGRKILRIVYGRAITFMKPNSGPIWRLGWRHAKVWILVLLLQIASFAWAGELRLTVTPAELSVGRDGVAEVTGTITNDTAKAVTLVLPADGSDAHMRTPITGWSLISTNSLGPIDRHPETPVPRKRGYGDINALRRDQVFILPIRGKKSFSAWLAPRDFAAAPGVYRAVFYYINDPKLKLTGYVLGKHDAGVEKRIRSSTPCRLVSNEIAVTVKD